MVFSLARSFADAWSILTPKRFPHLFPVQSDCGQSSRPGLGALDANTAADRMHKDVFVCERRFDQAFTFFSRPDNCIDTELKHIEGGSRQWYLPNRHSNVWCKVWKLFGKIPTVLLMSLYLFRNLSGWGRSTPTRCSPPKIGAAKLPGHLPF